MHIKKYYRQECFLIERCRERLKKISSNVDYKMKNDRTIWRLQIQCFLYTVSGERTVSNRINVFALRVFTNGSFWLVQIILCLNVGRSLSLARRLYWHSTVNDTTMLRGYFLFCSFLRVRNRLAVSWVTWDIFDGWVRGATFENWDFIEIVSFLWNKHFFRFEICSMQYFDSSHEVPDVKKLYFLNFVQ